MFISGCKKGHLKLSMHYFRTYAVFLFHIWNSKWYSLTHNLNPYIAIMFWNLLCHFVIVFFSELFLSPCWFRFLLCTSGLLSINKDKFRTQRPIYNFLCYFKRQPRKFKPLLVFYAGVNFNNMSVITQNFGLYL